MFSDGPPSRDCLTMACTPFNSLAYIIALPSSAHCKRELHPGKSNLFKGSPPTNGTIKSSRLDSFPPTQAIIFPSGEIEGRDARYPVSRKGSPPLIGTLHKCQSSVVL